HAAAPTLSRAAPTGSGSHRGVSRASRSTNSRRRFAIGVASETEHRLPNDSSAPQKRPQELKNQKNTNQVDSKDAGDAIGAEPLGDPAARRCHKLRPCEHNVCKCHWSDEYTRLADGTNCLVCAFSGDADSIVPGCAFSG